MNIGILIAVVWTAGVIFLIRKASAKIQATESGPLTDPELLRPRDPTELEAQLVSKTIRPTGTAILMLVMSLFMCAMALFFATMIWQSANLDARYEAEGQTVAAKVLDTRETAGSRGHRNYFVRYEFVLNGETYNGNGYLPSRYSLNEADRTKQLEVRYLPSEPYTNRPRQAQNMSRWGVLFCLLFLWPAGGIIWALRRDWELITRGKLAPGIVIGSVSAGRGSRRIVYDFLPSDEQVRRGKSSMNATPARDLAKGANVFVYYLPGNPKKNGLREALSWRRG
jgi:hypothetical protein